MDTVRQLNSTLTGRYEIEREIGAGGMATVYLARDLRHRRNVALKVLRPDLGAVLGVERFLSEIQVTANLQHPNLLPLFDSGEAEGLLFYVMPFVEGESLRDKLDREKQLPIDEVIHIATAVASALDYAHRHNVIHRDLKPENILLHEGQPLVADFGIALAVSNAGGGRITQTGLSLGTPKYMSPEQATGDRVIDARTDIYSLGAVTYELLTGDPPHNGSSSQAIIARVLTEQPRPIRSTRPHVPDHVEGAVERALEKLPADRFASAREFADALNGKVMVASRLTAARSAATTGKPGVRGRLNIDRLVPWAIAGLAAVAAIGGWWKASRSPEDGSPVRFALNLDSVDRVAADVTGSPFALSPDGKLLAFIGVRPNGSTRIYIRPLDDMRSRELEGTDRASQLFFSPDGRWLGYYANTELRKIPVDGGTSVQLAAAPGVTGISWASDDEIIFASQSQLFSVPAVGGTPREISKPDTAAGETSQRWPLALSDGKTVVYTSFGEMGSAGARIAVLNRSSGKTRITELAGTDPLAMIEGRLVYANAAGGLMSVKFDPGAGKYSGTPAPTVDGALVGSGGAFKGAVSHSGSVAYISGNATVRVVLASDSSETQVFPDEGVYAFPRFSPDGRRIAIAIGPPTARDIWVHELGSGTTQKLTSTGTLNDRPEWSPDGTRVLYMSNRDSAIALWWQPADMSTDPAILQKDPKNGIWEGVISPDGRTMIVRFDAVTTGYNEDLLYRSLSGDTALKRFVVSPFIDAAPRFSPDGRWIAYGSTQSGTPHVYVTPFPGPGARNLVSTGAGGLTPLWMPDGKRLVYVSGTQIIEATLTLSPAFSVTKRRVIYDGQFATSPVHANYDISPDGRRLLLLKRSWDNSRVVVIHDWKYELRAQMRAAKN